MVIKLKHSITAIVLVVLIIVGIFGVVFSRDYFIKAMYPIKYQDLIEKYTNENEIDPYFIFAVVKTESNFQADAVSNVGARGLMQMMDGTFHWVKAKLKDDQSTYDDMFDPEHNIQYGTYLIDYLVDEFGNYETALAAYHAGRGAVNKWLSDSRYSSDGITLDDIPISDTEHYVNKVMKNFGMYKSLYN